MRARKHENTLAASLFDLNIQTDVFYNLIDTFKKNLPVWHRYFEIRRKAMKLRDVTYYDMWAVSYTHLRAHETVLDLVCRLLLEKKTINKHE